MSNKQEVRSLRTTELRVQSDASGAQTLSGIIRYNSLSYDLGGWQELIAPGAFAQALAPDADVLCLRDHDASVLLGRTKSKTLTLTDSDEGLRFSCSLPNTTQARDLAESISRGDLDANSFGFITLEDKWTADESGTVLRTLIAVELMEISPCSFPAYPQSSVSVRQLPDSLPVELRSRVEKRDDDDDAEPNDNGCQCDCSECRDNDCEDCSDAECTDPDCEQERSRRNNDANKLLAIRIALEL